MIKMIKVVLCRDLHLPRFTMVKGSSWDVRPDRMQKKGFTLGGGMVYMDDFNVEGVRYGRK